MPALLPYPLAPLLKVSAQGAVLILLVLALQWLLRGRLHPRWRYALWLLVLLRLALPCTPASPTSVFNLVNFWVGTPSFRSAQATPGDPQFQPAASAAFPIQPTATSSGSGLPRWSRTGGPVLSFCLGVWACGSLALAGYLLITHQRLSRKVSQLRPLTAPALLELLEDCKEQMGVRVPITLIETPWVGSPSLFGFLRPRLLLPVGLTQSFSLAELRCVFLHEVGHVKRHDILVGWLTTTLQLLHWFNPLVWLAFYRMRVDRELACDALALLYVRAEEQPRYGHTIIKVLQHFGRPAFAPSLAGAVENQNQLKERIQMIANFKQTNRGPALALALTAALGLITFTDAQTATSRPGKELLGTWILVGRPGQVGEAPAAGGRLKSFTDTQWSMTQVDAKTGVVLFHHGGPYTLNGSDYVETVAFANQSTRDKIGKTHKYTLKIEGDFLTQLGTDNSWKEVWKRVRPDARPQKAEPVDLQGTWRGHEAGVAGTSSLAIRGSTLEFHGADSNEWYKATISAYDTAPKQLVVAITDCPVPQYAGTTAYAIYQLQDGTLTITGNEPGDLAAPAGFDAPGARKLVFKRE